MTTASATQDKLATHSSPAGYSHFVTRLAANNPHKNLVPARVMRAVLTKALADAELVDQAKKALMYGKDRPVIASFRDSVLITREMHPGEDYPAEDELDGMRRLHAALGMRSEADEILRHELTILCGGVVKHEDMVDELGDLAWYGQLYANALKVTVLTVIRRNVAKLITRFQGLSFSEARATAPDKAAEARAQASA